jgi:diketogulonate reductase-like aldo/keto reductase
MPLGEMPTIELPTGGKIPYSVRDHGTWGSLGMNLIDTAEMYGNGRSEECHEIPVMAYSPIDEGRMLTHHTIVEVAERNGATPAQVALAWIISQAGLVAIPEAGSFIHAKENRGALDVRLTEEDHAALDQALPAPRSPIPLEVT